jgi:hypothetical protein
LIGYNGSMNRDFHPLVLALVVSITGVFCALAVPAHAQMAGGGLNPANPIGATPGLHRSPQADEPPPPALPGGSAIDPDSQSQVQIDNENPTKVLFTAINHNNYAEARAAINRGARLNAQNALGETPIEMSVALNRNNITFMLLSMRAADGSAVAAAPAPGMAASGMAAPIVSVGVHVHARMKQRASLINQPPVFRPPPVSQAPGVPDPAAGFLGFNGAS